jgi:tetratricopeptide (TPR) repeat protein
MPALSERRVSIANRGRSAPVRTLRGLWEFGRQFLRTVPGRPTFRGMLLSELSRSLLQCRSCKGGRPMRQMFALILTLSAIPSAAHAQLWDKLSNPTIPVTLNHPPGLGLKVSKIAFGPASGKCADQIVETLISDFVSNQIEVVDRQNLNTILAEHNLALSGYVDQASAAAIGKILGPSALVFVKTQRCATEQDRLTENETKYDNRTKKNYPVRVYVSRTRAFLKVSIQTVDLATGRIFAARALDYSPEQRNKSYDGYPEAPAEFDVLDIAIKAAVSDVHRMFLPWSEKTNLIYYDNKEYGLKEAFELLKSGDAEGAFHRSQENLEKCKSDPQVKGKVLGHAYYNLGMSYMIRNEHDKALENFREAARLQPGDIVTKAMADCQRAKDLALEMQQVEDKAAVEAEKEQAEGEKAARAEKASVLTNADVVQMVQSKLSDAIIIHKIKSSKSNFDTSSEALVALTKAGVSEQIVMAMMGP